VASSASPPGVGVGAVAATVVSDGAAPPCNAASRADLACGVIGSRLTVAPESGTVEQAASIYGPVDVLVNNAALNYYVPIVDYDVARWMRAFAVNVHGPFMLSKFVLPAMIERRGGAIVNISSGAAIGPGRGPYDAPGRGGTMYGASKAALERFTQGLAQEVAEHGIAVSCFSPSQVVPTPGTVYHKLVSGMDDPRGEPPEIMARAALLLATEDAGKINGRVTYSQQILQEFGWIDNGRGRGIDSPGSGYSQI